MITDQSPQGSSPELSPEPPQLSLDSPDSSFDVLPTNMEAFTFALSTQVDLPIFIKM